MPQLMDMLQSKPYSASTSARDATTHLPHTSVHMLSTIHTNGTKDDWILDLVRPFI